MQTDNKIRNYYYHYKKRSHKPKQHLIHPNIGYILLIAGIGLAILFLSFSLSEGFENIIMYTIGIFSLLLVIVGIIILANGD